MMRSVIKVVKKVVDAVPGKRFGIFRFLPFMFLAGATLEYVMIHWTVGTTNFYNTFRKRQAHKRAIKEMMESGELTLEFLVERHRQE